MIESPFDDIWEFEPSDVGDFDDTVLANRYFHRPRGSLWSWDAREGVLCWADGTTICFRAELDRVLERLAPRGLPSFGAVAVLLAACRENWRAASESLREDLRRSLEAAGLESAPQYPNLIRLRGVIQHLDRIHRFPATLRSSFEAKAVLADIVFEDSQPRVPTEHAAGVLAVFRSGEAPENLPFDLGEVIARFDFNGADLVSLLRGLERVDEEILRLRLRTGLDAVPQAAVVDTPDALAVRRLLAELRGDPELTALSRLASDLMAAVQLPHCVSDLEDLPVGGVSDITNKGPLDRLVLSELAYDDDTLTARIALREALFLRREHPPQRPPGTRSLLLDAGIRVWGLPRPFALAVALAFAATAGKERVTAHRVGADGLQEVDLRTREGVVTHLEALGTAPHPGDSVPRFLTRLAENEVSGDAVLVTHEDTLRDPDFARVLSDIEVELYVATVSGQGRFRLHHVTHRGSQIVREAQIDLESLFCEPPTATPSTRSVVESLRDPEHDAELPGILRLRSLPLRLPWRPDPRLSVCTERHGVLSITRDRRLLRIDGGDVGAHEVTSLLPPGPYHWVEVDEDASRGHVVVRAVCGVLPRHPVLLVRVNPRDGSANAVELPVKQSSPLGVTEREGVLLLVGVGHVQGFDSSTGERLCEIALPEGLSYRGGRFFSDRGEWYALVADGSRTRLERARPVPSADLVLFDRLGSGDGPWSVTRRGTVAGAHSADGEIRCRFQRLPSEDGHLLGVSRDGQRVAFRGDVAGGDQFLVDLDVRRIDVRRDAHRDLEPGFLRLRKEMSVRERRLFNTDHCVAIGVERDGSLCLAFREAYAAALVCLNGESFWMKRPRLQSHLVSVRWQPFGARCRFPRVGYTLRVARWPDGSRAFLDSRGLLHLKSSNPRVPEVTAVLCDTRTAVWSPKEGPQGGLFFTGRGRDTRTDAVHSQLLCFTSELL